jgi:hypothetical protein
MVGVPPSSPRLFRVTWLADLLMAVSTSVPNFPIDFVVAVDLPLKAFQEYTFLA